MRTFTTNSHPEIQGVGNYLFEEQTFVSALFQLLVRHAPPRSNHNDWRY
jgi:hypothetical protein